ncbi:MAG TPA: ion channel, partial [Alphaproteobacteria bacterium]|nr:ion channel [Alphaproteobacteria bacterium]
MAKPTLGLIDRYFADRRRRRWRMAAPDPHLAIKLAAYLTLMALLHIAAMMALEGMSAMEGLWLTATTLTTVGYGDLSAKTPAGRMATILLVYVGGIFVLAGAINTWLDRKADRHDRQMRGAWKWKMRDHLLIIGTPAQQPTAFFRGIAQQIRASRGWQETPILLLTRAYSDGTLPQRLADLGIVHYDGDANSDEDLVAADAAVARGIIVLAESEVDRGSDAATFYAIHRLRELGYAGPLVAEVVADGNRDRLTAQGATATVRPMRGYPEMLVRGLLAPGAERILEDLFTAQGDECLL